MSKSGLIHARLSRRSVIFGAVALSAVSACVHTRAPTRTLALTFDDLPYAADKTRNALTDAQRVTQLLTGTLQHPRAPSVAFVNEGRLSVIGEEDARTALLQDWMKSRAQLANHTFSHLDFNSASVEEFSADVLKGSIVCDALTRRRAGDQRYFRFPLNHTGPNLESKQAMEAFLASHHYSIAPYTIDSADTVFNPVYVDARARGDDETAMRLRRAYVDFVLEATAFAEGVAMKIFGRAIPQVLLMHANELNADCLDDLLSALRAQSYGFVTLDEAMRDVAYQTPDTLVTKFGPSWLWRWRKSLGLDVSFAGDPEPADWVLELGKSS